MTSGWTVKTLYRHFSQRFADQDKAVQAALDAAEKAVIKAETAADKRFESVNEFRAQLTDQAQTFMPRAEADLRFKALSDKVDVNTDSQSRSTGDTSAREQIKGLWVPIVVSIASIGFNIVLGLLLVFKK